MCTAKRSPMVSMPPPPPPPPSKKTVAQTCPAMLPISRERNGSLHSRSLHTALALLLLLQENALAGVTEDEGQGPPPPKTEVKTGGWADEKPKKGRDRTGAGEDVFE